MIQRIFYCNTLYSVKPPVDINPLILLRYKKEKILVLCARASMIKRANQALKGTRDRDRIDIYGWWDLRDIDFLDHYDVIVIVGRDRISHEFHPLLKNIEDVLGCSQRIPAG